MLYITTRDNTMEYSAVDALSCERGQKGGLFVPKNLPSFTPEMLQSLQINQFSATVADVLNLFFPLSITSWDIDFSIGRSVQKLITLNRKISVAELWHNPEHNASSTYQNLHNMLCAKAGVSCPMTNWSAIAVRIAVFAGLYGQMVQTERLEEKTSFDICVSTDDFSAVMAAWYARAMGLPIESILCTNRDDTALWNMIRLGEFNPAAGDRLPLNVERLIHGALGVEETEAYLKSAEACSIYAVAEEKLPCLNEKIFVSVVGDTRVQTVIRSLRSINGYGISLDCARCYGALQDYHSRAGESRPALLLAEEKA